MALLPFRPLPAANVGYASYQWFNFKHQASYWCSVVKIVQNWTFFSKEYGTDRRTEKRIAAVLNNPTVEWRNKKTYNVT